jgi:hypothetical protein
MPHGIGVGSRFAAMKRILEARGAKPHEMKNLAQWAGRRRPKPKRPKKTPPPPDEVA